MGNTANQDGSTQVKITYQTLFEILRTEKQRDDLQGLHEDYFKNIAQYLKDKERFASKQDHNYAENDAAKQLMNAKRLIRDIYDRRESKISEMAQNKARMLSESRQVIIDTKPLLPEEKIMFDEIVKIFAKFREKTLTKVLSAQAPSKSKDQKKSIDKKLVRFISKVEKFVGKQMENYGPYEPEDVASMPADIAEILIGKGKAEEIKQG